MKFTHIFIQKTTRRSPKQPKKRPEPTGCMNIMLGLVFLIVLIFFLAGCLPDAPIRNAPEASAIISKQVVPPKYKVLVFGDNSGSILYSGIPRLQDDDFGSILQTITKGGGELTVGMVKSVSKQGLVRFRPELEPARPIQKQGESATTFRNRIMRHQAKLTEFKSKRINNDLKVAEFETDLQALLHAPLAGCSDIAGAAEIAQLIMSESDPDMDDAIKAVIFVTDGINNSNGKFPKKIPCPVIMVTSESSAHDLAKYNPTMVTNIDAAFRLLLNDEL